MPKISTAVDMVRYGLIMHEFTKEGVDFPGGRIGPENLNDFAPCHRNELKGWSVAEAGPLGWSTCCLGFPEKLPWTAWVMPVDRCKVNE